MDDDSKSIRRYDPVWTSAGPNVLSEGCLKRVEEALHEGWICGLHLYYVGGGSPDAVAFRTYEMYLSHLERSRPGDLFILWSIGNIRRAGLMLVDWRCAKGAPATESLRSSLSLTSVEQYLAEKENREVLAVMSSGPDPVETVVAVLDGSGWDAILAGAQRARALGGVFYVLPFTTIDCSAHYLVKAKRPNASGEVPLGGAY